MNEPVEATGATVEEAIERALDELGAREDEVEIEILSEGGGRGLLSRRSKEAAVRVRFRDERTPEEIAAAQRGEEAPPPDDDLLDDQADAAEDFLNGLLDVLDMDGEAAAEIEGSAILVDIGGPDLAVLIGRHGSTLEALQELSRAAVQHQTRARALVSVDIDGYRARQREYLERRVRGLAAKVRKTRRPLSLDPMSSYERKIVHTALSGFPGVTTSSEGEDPERRIVIRPA